MSFVEKFGLQYLEPKGYVVESKKSSKYKHRFGGSSWKVVDDCPLGTGATLLFVLDLSDPKLSELAATSLLKELPICSYMNSDIWVHEQIYKINNTTREVLLISKSASSGTVFDEDEIPNPLPEKAVDLREMVNAEYPITEQLYWNNTDEFLGGQSFIRVLGCPLWLQDPIKQYCSCNSEMKFVMGIGYESWNGPFRFLDSMPFFLGESALYVFYCGKCSEMKVISQSA